MQVRVTYYLEVLSSWCFWAEPAWADLKRRYGDRVEFGWKIALMEPEAYPKSQSQCEWFYRRSGSIVRSQVMLNSGWLEPALGNHPVPSHVAEAAKDLGIADDRVRLALARAALLEGRKIGRLDESLKAALEGAHLDGEELGRLAQSPGVAGRVQKSTAEFRALQVSQRPTFLVESDIGDRAVFSGLVRAEPLAATIDAMLDDAGAYASWKAHFGDPPGS